MSKGNRKRRRELGLLAEPTKCSARKRDGTPCGASPIRGSSVCRMHGGGAPQTVAAARRRLMAASDRVGALLLRIAEDESTPAPVRLAAIRDVLDRAGVTVKQEVEVTVQPWQQLIEGIVSEVPDEDIRTLGALGKDNVVDGEVVEPLLTKAVALPPLPTRGEDDATRGPDAPPPNGTITDKATPRIPSRRRRGNRLAGH